LNKKLFNVALLLASVFLSLIVIEMGVRTISLVYYKTGWTYQFANFRKRWIALEQVKDPAIFDPELGWIPNQGVWKSANDVAGNFTYTILEDGIRSNGSGEVPDPPEAILAVGDSTTFGDEVSDQETWPAQLEKLSGRRVINGGVFAYGIDQAFLRLKGLLRRDRPSTVIFSFTPDDIARCQMSERSRAKPYFDLKDGQLKLENVPVPPPSPFHNESKLVIALEHSLLVHTVMRRLYPDWWVGYHSTQVHDEQQGRLIACALLHELEGLAKTRGFKLIVLVQHLEEEPFSETTAAKSVLKCLSDPATRVLDLEPALSEVKAEDPARYNRLYFGMRSHMTAEGNQFVALEIYKLLTQGQTQVDRSGLSPAR
jgi:hypothetical protein